MWTNSTTCNVVLSIKAGNEGKLMGDIKKKKMLERTYLCIVRLSVHVHQHIYHISRDHHHCNRGTICHILKHQFEINIRSETLISVYGPKQLYDPSVFTQNWFFVHVFWTAAHSSMSTQPPRSGCIDQPCLHTRHPFGPAVLHPPLSQAWWQCEQSNLLSSRNNS